MKKIKKLIKNLKVIYINRGKIENVKGLLRKEFGDIEFNFASFGGADINYILLQDNKKFAMLRLAIADVKEDGTLPILRFNKQKRIEKEFKAYKVGAEYGLTPKVLYSFDDGVVCEYLEGERVFNILQKDKGQVWDILIDAVRTYRKLHDLGIVHLDATLKNFVMTEDGVKVIDFEYYPSVDLSFEVQKAYDYVRVIEHTLRTIPENYQKDYHQFIEELDKIIPDEIREVDFQYVKPWIKNIQTFPVYTELRDKIFTKLTFN